jgi:hypothetical protein
MTLVEKIFGNALGAYIQYGWTAAKGKLLPLKVTDNGDDTGTLNVAVGSAVLPTGAATEATVSSIDGKLNAVPAATTICIVICGKQADGTVTPIRVDADGKIVLSA